MPDAAAPRALFSQVEYCDNLIFRRRAARDKLGERLLDALGEVGEARMSLRGSMLGPEAALSTVRGDSQVPSPSGTANRTIGQPNKISVIFGRRIGKYYRGKLQTEIADMDLPNPVIHSHYGNGFGKQYVRDHLVLRTEAGGNNVRDYGVSKSVENLPALRDALAAINDNYLNVQQDILETFIDRGQLRKLAEPTITATGKRIPGLKLDQPRQLALMQALVRFANVTAGNTFTTAELYPRGRTGRPGRTLQPRLASLRPHKTPRKTPRRQASSIPSLSTLAAGIFNLPALPEAVRPRLCAAYRRRSQPGHLRIPDSIRKSQCARSSTRKR
jgi:hypothetical protein